MGGISGRSVGQRLGATWGRLSGGHCAHLRALQGARCAMPGRSRDDARALRACTLGAHDMHQGAHWALRGGYRDDSRVLIVRVTAARKVLHVRSANALLALILLFVATPGALIVLCPGARGTVLGPMLNTALHALMICIVGACCALVVLFAGTPRAPVALCMGAHRVVIGRCGGDARVLKALAVGTDVVHYRRSLGIAWRLLGRS